MHSNIGIFRFRRSQLKPQLDRHQVLVSVRTTVEPITCSFSFSHLLSRVRDQNSTISVGDNMPDKVGTALLQYCVTTEDGRFFQPKTLRECTSRQNNLSSVVLKTFKLREVRSISFVENELKYINARSLIVSTFEKACRHNEIFAQLYKSCQ